MGEGMSSESFELNTQLIRAGAGAGKTTRLVNQVYAAFVHFRNNEIPNPRFVVTTFTRKATQELKERLLLKAQENDDSEFEEFVLSNGSLLVSTIHGVMVQFLRRYAHQFDLDSQFQILLGDEEYTLATRICRDLIYGNPIYSELLDSYGFYEIVSALIKADHLFFENQKLSFFDHSDEEVALENLSKLELKEFSNTIDSILQTTMDEKWLNYASDMRKVLKQGLTASELLSDILSLQKPRFSSKTLPVTEELRDQLAGVLKRMKGILSLPLEKKMLDQVVHDNQVFFDLLKDFHRKLFEEKKTKGVLSMSDIECLSLHLLRENPKIGEAFSNEWDYWLIDELQDTSPLQMELIQRISGSKPRFLVGDPQQSIYLFRGARKEVFQNIEQTFKNKDTLMKNYRSLPELLCFINDFFSKLGEGFDSMVPREESFDPSKVVADLMYVEDVGAEIDAVVGRIRELSNDGVPFQDICVLARANRDLDELARNLENANVPIQIHSAGGYTKRREIADLCALGRFVLNPHNDEVLVQVLRSPWCRVSDQSLTEFASLRDKKSLWQKISNHPNVTPLLKLLENSREFGITEGLRTFVFNTEFVDASLYLDPSGRREANLWKFLVQLRKEEHNPGFNYLKFFTLGKEQDAEKDNESDAVSALEPQRVNLMTVHASKGLQFSHVIVPFLTKTIQAGKSTFLTHDEESGKIGLPIRDELGNRRNMVSSERWRRVLKERELEEADRLLYVAVTRAKESVSLTLSERDIGQTWKKKLNWDFALGIHQKKKYTYRVRSGTLLSENRNSKKTLPPLKKPLLNSNSLTKRRVSATELVEKQKDTKPIESDLDYLKSVERIQRGTNIHRLFEVSALHGKDPKDFLYLVEKSEQEQLGVAIDFLNSLTEPPMKQLFVHGNPEWGFLSKMGEDLVEGQIDLWGTVDAVTWIVDYKTGSEAYVEKAFQQLEIYKSVIQKVVNGSEIKMAAVFPLSEKVFIRD